MICFFIKNLRNFSKLISENFNEFYNSQNLSNNPVKNINKQHISSDDLNSYLSNYLPPYMIPSFFIKLDELPLNTSGKIDSKALLAYEVNKQKKDDVHYVPPRNKTEEELCVIWQEILGIDNVGIKDNFFRIGGNSILSIQLASKIRQEGFDISVSDIFEVKTIEELAAKCKK